MNRVNTVDDLMTLLNSDYNPVMHLIEGENLKAEDFRNKQFHFNGITIQLEEICVAYPVVIEQEMPCTDFYLELCGRNGEEQHEVLIHFPHDRQKQALELYASIDTLNFIRVNNLFDSDEDERYDDYWGFVKTFKADRCINPFSLLNAVCMCSNAIQDFIKCRETSKTDLIDCSIFDFASCTDFMVNKALSIAQTYCSKQLHSAGFDTFSTPIVKGQYKKDLWESRVFYDEESNDYRGAFRITLRGGQRGWLIGNSEQELKYIAKTYLPLAELIKDGLQDAYAKRHFEATPDYPLEEFYAWQMRELLGCLTRISETPIVPFNRDAACSFMTWGLRCAENLGMQSLAAFKEYLHFEKNRKSYSR